MGVICNSKVQSVFSERSDFVVSDGAIELLKWLGLFFMTCDHVNRYLFASTLPGFFELGRLAMPLFGFVIAYNLARPGALVDGTCGRIVSRLALYGLVATPFFFALRGSGSIWPLNILFTFIVFVAVLFFIRRGGLFNLLAAYFVFVLGGALVDYLWFGVAFCLAAWWFCRTSSLLSFLAWTATISALCVFNGSYMIVVALAMCLFSSFLHVEFPRFRRVFYIYYPAHLAAIFLLSKIF